VSGRKIFGFFSLRTDSTKNLQNGSLLSFHNIGVNFFFYAFSFFLCSVLCLLKNYSYIPSDISNQHLGLP